MLGNEIPQWVSHAFIRSAQAVGATADREVLNDACASLVERWSEPSRHFHNQRHLYDMLARIDTLAPETQHPDLVRLAAWGHGIVFSTSDQAVYSKHGGEDEAASAELIGEIYSSLGISDADIEVIQKLISSLRRRHHIDHTLGSSDDPAHTAVFEAIDMDRLALCDAHLGTLAGEPQRYKKYLADVREEYSHIPEEHWLQSRREIVTRLLARKKIYLSPLAAQWEPNARQNLQAELERLNAKIADSAVGAAAPEVWGLGEDPSVSEVPPSPVSTENVQHEASSPTRRSIRDIVQSAEEDRPIADGQTSDQPREDATTAWTGSDVAQRRTAESNWRPDGLGPAGVGPQATDPEGDNPAGANPAGAHPEITSAEAASRGGRGVGADGPEGMDDDEIISQLFAESEANAEDEEDADLKDLLNEAIVEGTEYSSLAHNVERQGSTMEELDEVFDPGTPPRELTAEEERIARREQIARETLESIENKRAAAEKRRAEAARQANPSDASRPTMENEPDY